MIYHRLNRISNPDRYSDKQTCQSPHHASNVHFTAAVRVEQAGGRGDGHCDPRQQNTSLQLFSGHVLQ